MKSLLILILVFFGSTSGMVAHGPKSSASLDPRTPVLVELFTPEGCSSCPPADAFLQKLDRQPIARAEMIVLSEHVDYWNHIGWKDPYSSRFSSDRQGIYAKRLGLDSVYTPQMIVDGTSEFVGSDAALADKAVAKALTRPKVALRLSYASLGAPNLLQAHLETDTPPPSFGLRDADVYVAVALNHAESQVAHGENAGRTLTHTAVVRSIVKVGTLRQGQSFVQDIQMKIDPGTDRSNLRLVAFLQVQGQDRVIGATVETVGATIAARK